MKTLKGRTTQLLEKYAIENYKKEELGKYYNYYLMGKEEGRKTTLNALSSRDGCQASSSFNNTDQDENKRLD